MGKITPTLIVSILIAVSPVLVQAQSFRATGFRGGNTVPTFRGAFSTRGSINSRNGSTGFTNGRIGSRSSSITGIGKRGFSPGLSNTNRHTFGNNSNLTASTLNSSISTQPQNLIKARKGLVQSGNIHTAGPNQRSFTRNKGLGSSSLNGEQNAPFIPLRKKAGSTFEQSEISNQPAIGMKRVSVSGVVNLRGLSSATRNNGVRPESLKNKGIVANGASSAASNFSNSPTQRTEISHWVDDKTGVLHFSNNVTSFRKGRETIVFVNGKKADSKSAASNSNKTDSTVSKNSLTTPRAAVLKSAVRGNNNSSGSNRGLMLDSDSRSATAFHNNRNYDVFHHHFHSHFFFSPFFTLPQSTFFFAFNPFAFRVFVLSPFFNFSPLHNFFFLSSPFTPLIPSPLFSFRPIFFSPFFTPFTFGSAFFFNNPIISNPIFVLSDSTFIH